MSIEEIFAEAQALSREDRLRLAESIIESVYEIDPEVEARWAEIAKRRMEEIDSGKVEAIPSEEVFAKIRRRFGIE